MSRSHTCYDCGGHTEAYDDAYCTACMRRRDEEEQKKKVREAAEHAAAIITLEKMGFTRQADILRQAVKE